ncbi:WAP four-disulfide core domain protein 6B-like [Spea bombifrons]|uniref:WAP four-disulfide core domain protein 6B-like n=1 Tax=Spea bombifrons TaxID=233779 RepID=UPI00234B53DD|nr:WAP four-disulfide core domain protein 6B-like [Spea bombifrons]
MWPPIPVLLGLLLLTSDSLSQDSDCDDPAGVGGSGPGAEIRWSYDKSQQICRAFVQKEDGKSRNSFSSERECLRRCSPGFNALYPPGEAVCGLPQDAGPCMALILMWYYDPQREACDTFFYSGCQGNGNRFDSKTNCTGTCITPRKGRSSGTNLSEEPSSSETDAGLVIGIVFGCVFGAAFLITLILFLVQRKKLKKQHKRVPAVEMN